MHNNIVPGTGFFKLIGRLLECLRLGGENINKEFSSTENRLCFNAVDIRLDVFPDAFFTCNITSAPVAVASGEREHRTGRGQYLNIKAIATGLLLYESAS